MTLKLTYKNNATVPLEVEGITPDVVQTLSLDEIAALEIFEGNQTGTLGHYFDVEGDASDGQIHWHGDLSGVHWIGAKMKSGRLEVHGPAGRHIGSDMTDGEIIIHGDAGDWVGAELHGGLIHVKGRAGHLVGAAYRGSVRGMTGGTILIDGDVGNELGHTMRRGLIAVGGNAGDLIGFNMLAGTVLVFGNSGIRHGAGMRRGTIGLFGEERPPILPTFRKAGAFDVLAIRLVFQQLQDNGFNVPDSVSGAEFDLFHGDFLEGGRGEMLLRA